MRRIIFFIGILLVSLQVSAANTDQSYIVSLSDIHFDPFAYCHTTNCPILEKLRQANPAQWSALLKNVDSQLPSFKQDTNYTLLNSALQNMHSVATPENPKLVVVLGDMLGHDFRRKYIKYSKDKTHGAYRAFVFKTFTFIAQQIKQSFPDSKIYNVVGNNDSYLGNYVSDVKGNFFQDIGSLWAQAAGENTLAPQFSTAGYYAVDLPDHVRLIALNTNLFSYNARGKNIDAAAMVELAWLRQQLQNAKAAKQKVMIAMHIPPGINLYAASFLPSFTVLNLWKATYQQNYDDIIRDFSNNIIAIFSGHLHADWYQANSVNANIIPFTVTPAISPIYETNPAFKIYTYQNNRLTGFTTHQFPLSQKRISLVQTSFNLSQNLRCENPTDETKMVDWNAYYHCSIL